MPTAQGGRLPSRAVVPECPPDQRHWSGRACAALEPWGLRDPGASLGPVLGEGGRQGVGLKVAREAPSPEEALLTSTFLWLQTLQGLFFDDSYGFYPGQVLIGPAKIFSSVQWLSGVKPVLSTKSKFRVVVEEVGLGAGGEVGGTWS